MSNSVIVKWLGGEAYAKVKKEEERRMNLTTRYLRNAVIRRIGVKYPPASRPGEPPHLRTGQLRNSIATEVDTTGGKVTGRVGTNLRYAKYLELQEFLNRSFLHSTLQIEAENVKRMLIGQKIL